MTANSRLALIPLALVALGAGPADQYVPVGKDNEAIVYLRVVPSG